MNRPRPRWRALGALAIVLTFSLAGCRGGPTMDRFGAEGVVDVTIFERDAGDPATDITTVETLWRSLGITTSRRTGGGDHPGLGLLGQGGPVSSIEFDASRLGSTIDGSSPCAAGDFDELVDRDPDE